MPVLQYTLLLRCLYIGCMLMSLTTVAHGRDHVRLQLKWHHQFQFAGYYVAKEKGYFEEQNLDVELIEGSQDKPPLKQVLDGAAEYGISDSDIVMAHVAGKPVVAVAAIFQHSPYVLISLDKNDTFTPDDLIGKSIMLSNDQGSAQFKAMMRKENIDLSRVRILPHTWNLDDLINHKVDVISAYATVEPIQLEMKGYKAAVLSSQAYGVDFYGDTLFTTKNEASNHPERVEALLRAVKKGWSYAFNHPEEVIDLIMQYDSVARNGITRDILKREAQAMRPYVMSDIVEIGHMNHARWEFIAKTLADLNMMPAQYDLDGFIYEPKQVIEHRVLLWLGGIGLALVSLIGTIAIWNLQIRRKVRLRTTALQDEILRREQAEDLLKIAGSLAKLGGWVMDVDSQQVIWSDEVAAIHDLPAGYSPTAPEGMSLFVPEHRPVIERAVADCINKGLAYDLELQKVTAKGRNIWVRTIGRPVRNGEW